MKSIEHLMQKTGISQRSLAALIDTRQSIVSRHQNSVRSLPAAAMLQLATLYNIAAAVPEPVAMTGNDARAWLLEHADWCRTQSIQVEKKWRAAQTNYKQAVFMLQLLDRLDESGGTITEKKQRLMDEQRYQAQNKKEQNSLLAQKKLEMALQLLQHEAALYEAATVEGLLQHTQHTSLNHSKVF